MFCGCYKRREILILFVHKVAPENIQRKTSDAANNEKFVNIFVVFSCTFSRAFEDVITIGCGPYLAQNMLIYLSLDIICSSKLTVSLRLRPRKTVRILEKIFSRQIEAIVYVSGRSCSLVLTLNSCT